MAKNDKIASVTDYFGVIEPYGDHFFLTRRGSLIGAIEVMGWDADGLLPEDHMALSVIARQIYGRLSRNIVVTQYYSHFDGVKVSIADRAEPKSHLLSKRREAHLNKQQLSGSRIVHYLEMEPDDDINKLKFPALLRHLASATFDTHSRAIVANALSPQKAFLLENEQLANMAVQLADAIKEVAAKWTALFPASVLSQQQTWAHLRFLASLNQRALDDGLSEMIPSEDLDIYVSAGDISNVRVEGMDVLKLSGVTNTYARVAAVRRFMPAGAKIKPGLWASDTKAPARQKGNYVLMTRWKALTEFQRAWMFQKKNTALERAQLSLIQVLKGGEERSEVERQAGMRPRIKKLMDELGAAESITDLWGTGDAFLVAFGADPKAIKQTSLLLNQAAGNSSMNLIWETVDIDRAFRAFQPGQRAESARELYMTAVQFGAASLLCQPSPGQRVVPDLVCDGKPEEPQYLFTSREGSVFGYSSFIGGRSMVVGVGPIRSGKTFAKNTKAAHFLKYAESLYRAIDIDPGSENLGHMFGEGRGIFRVGTDSGRGFNPFVNYRGPGDKAFRAHFTALAHVMLQANDSKADKELEPLEQDKFDDALEQTLQLINGGRAQTLAHFVAHLDKPIRRKFSRWVRSNEGDSGAAHGRYAHLFDANQDSIGKLDSRVGVFNLGALRDDAKALNPVLLEVLFRITQAFEDPELRNVPKQLDVDEAHYLLSIPQAADFVISKVRTWGKWFGSVNLWSQSPEEFERLPSWSAIRSAATTFWFMADPQMDVDLYQRTFHLTRGQCEAIKSLTPKREAFVWQPEIGVSKVVVIDVEAEQRVFNTSHPREASIRDRLIAAHGFEEGMRLAVEALEAPHHNGPDLRVVA